MLNLGELACAVQEKAELVVLLMNDSKGKRESIKVKVPAGEKLPPITRSWE